MKRKTASRRTAKIKHPRPRIDDELAELATVLDEYRIDASFKNWFVVPWRDGWNAFLVAHSCFLSQLDEYNSNREQEIDVFLRSLTKDKAAAHEYFRASEMLEGIDRDDVSPLLHAALRCIQVMISHSSGGGHVYNDVLKKAFKDHPPEIFEEIVLEHRCRDAIGTTSVMQGDQNDRTRRAFAIAWRRGLYLAAYSLPQAKT